MAQPIDQNTIQTYDTYTIKIDDNNDHNIPLNAFYLVPYLKNDSNEKSKYDRSNVVDIKNKTFYTLGDKNFDVTINVEDHIMTTDEFVNRVLFVKYPSIRDHERITSILSILPCTKALYLGVLCILLNSGDYPDDGEDPILDRMQFLADLRDLKQVDVYGFVMDELLKMINNENPINAEDYYPKIEYDELTEPYDLVHTHQITASTEYSVGTNYKNVIKIKSNKFDVDENEMSRAKESFMNIEKLYESQVGKNKPILESTVDGKDAADGSDQSRILKIKSFPSSLFKIKKNVVTNITKHCTITIPKGFEFLVPVYQNDWLYYRSTDWHVKHYYCYTTTEDIVLGPGGSVTITGFIIYRKITSTKSRDLTVSPNPQNIKIRQKQVDWNFELLPDLGNKYISRKSDNKYQLKNVNNARILKTNKDEHTITNTSKTLKITIPKGEKYYVEGEKTVQILRNRVVKEIITVAVTVFYTVVAAIKNFWGWLTGKKTIQQARQEFRQEVQERVETWYENQILRLSKSYKIQKDIVLLPGETYTLPTPNEDEASTYKNKIYLTTDTILNIVRNYTYDDKIAYNTNIKITANIIDDPSTLNDNIQVDDKTVNLKVPMEFRNSSENKFFELKDGNLSFTKGNVSLSKKYTNYKNILLTKNNDSTLQYILDNFLDSIGVSNRVRGNSVSFNDVGDKFVGDGPNKLYFEYTPATNGKRKYGLAKTVNGVDQSTGINIPTTYGKLSSSNNFGLTKKQRITLTVDKEQFENIMRADILKNIRNLTNDVGTMAGLEENVIYHINKINVTPTIVVSLKSEAMNNDEYKNSLEDINFLLNNQNSEFVFKIGDFTITYNGGVTVKELTGQTLGFEWAWIFPIPTFYDYYHKILQPIGVTSKYTLDVSKLNLFYYNGIIYVK